MSDTHETPLPELLRVVAGKLMADRDAEWSRIRMHVRAVSGYQESETWVTTPDGDTMKVFRPLGLGVPLHRLRDAMYQPGAGTWFSADLVVDPSGSVETSFDFDHEPEWDRLLPEQYRNDLERYPRDDDHIPEWLRNRLAEAAGG